MEWMEPLELLLLLLESMKLPLEPLELAEPLELTERKGLLLLEKYPGEQRLRPLSQLLACRCEALRRAWLASSCKALRARRSLRGALRAYRGTLQAWRVALWALRGLRPSVRLGLRQRLRVRLRLRLGLRPWRCGALERRIDRLGALLPLSLSLATRAPRCVGALELRAEDLDELLLTLSLTARDLRRSGARELRSEDVLRQCRTGSALRLPRGAAAVIVQMIEMNGLREDIVMDIEALMLLEIATHNVAEEGMLCLRQRLRPRLRLACVLERRPHPAPLTLRSQRLGLRQRQSPGLMETLEGPPAPRRRY